ncbi:hypothetical protein [Pantoea ananatis]|uniref:hypothetical protein n=1 Tax=Pantoea ananas TaxID=553 RepID=UPI0023505F8E|nr:hypothetical protein [Pantoea ananatis]MDC7860709.1 hypothetical protein [Pantoea ananatis]
MNKNDKQFVSQLVVVMTATGLVFISTGLIWHLAGGDLLNALTDTPVFRIHPPLFSRLWHVPVWTCYSAGLRVFLSLLLAGTFVSLLLMFRLLTQRSGSFIPEEGYTVLQETDVQHALSKEEVMHLAVVAEKVREGRRKAGKKDLSCVVVEHDWPEYVLVWRMLEKRVNGEQKQ